MKKFLSYFFLMFFCASGAMADNAVTPSRAIAAPSENVISSRNITSSRAVVGKNISETDSETDKESKENSDLQIDSKIKTRTAKSSSKTNVIPSRAAVSRSNIAGNGSDAGRVKLESTVNTVGRSSRTDSASINNTATVKRAGITLRPSTAEVGGRATISGTDIQTGSNLNLGKARSVSARATERMDAETIAQATDRLTQASALNSSCQEQYNDCMDQFCSVIDANQKRCTCSANISKYEKVEDAVQSANTQLNQVAQRIRYVGLSESEIEAINSATEAEEVLDKTTDKTESRNMLEQIEDLIKDPTVVSSSSGSSSGLDLDLSFDSDSSDLFSIDFLGGNSGSSSFANLRGSDLFKTATKRCKVVLTQCDKAGADTDQIVANYDLLIDKDCIVYEQGLTKMNDALKTNVRSATRMLQKARLAVLENQNEYDAKACISALSDCMTDDMVCGSDYSKCIDPTKRYIDENGSVVLGENISNITAFMENYNNALIDDGFLKSAEGESISVDNCKDDDNNDGTCIVKYLLNKIGTGDTITDGGLCRGVLDRCQQYTYDDDDYMPYNNIVVNYVQRAMVNIQAAQRQIISDYASSCMVDIADCYNDQVSQVSSWSTSASVDSIYKVMRGACRNVSLTCSYAVFAGDPTSCPSDGTDEDLCIESASTIFYQSLLCPDDSSYSTATQTSDTDGTYKGYVNDHCICNSGYVTWDGECTQVCDAGEYRSSTGACYDCDANYYSEGFLTATLTQDTCHLCSEYDAGLPYSDSGSGLSGCSATE